MPPVPWRPYCGGNQVKPLPGPPASRLGMAPQQRQGVDPDSDGLTPTMRPSLPDLDAYLKLLRGIWGRRWLTNNGVLHQEFESRLAAFLGVEHLSLFCNGTTAMLVALRALDILDGEVITTPFTFPATPHVLSWSRITPVFCDIEEATMNLDPERIERLIGPRTRAIMPVHVYGTPCDGERIREIASAHGLRVLYDAAHAFAVQQNGRSVLDMGDVSMVSFHATKVFSTIEGGALVLRSAEQKQRVDLLKNFGIADAETVVEPGINGKMNELQAAYGLLQLDEVGAEIRAREKLWQRYRQLLEGVKGIRCLAEIPGVRRNYSYFPILVDPAVFGLTRDDLNAELRAIGVACRKYFYPLASNYPCYSALPSAQPEGLPVATRTADQVLCLPIFADLDPAEVERIGERILALKGKRPR
jgi:dTDP-4-amino-4,6-dideoxygalactose transaminase